MTRRREVSFALSVLVSCLFAGLGMSEAVENSAASDSAAQGLHRVRRQFSSSSAVFVGRILKNLGDSPVMGQIQMRDERWSDLRIQADSFSVHVERSWKGIRRGEKVSVVSNVQMEAKKKYLIYGTWTTDSTSLHAFENEALPVEQAKLDLKWLNSMRRLRPKPSPRP